MNFLHKYRIGLLFSISGILFLIAYKFIGSSVDENGVLIETFGFIPLFWLFQLLAIIALIVTFFKNKNARN